jgi:anthranilate 1,2-dioxygenase ferredoxin subunit
MSDTNNWIAVGDVSDISPDTGTLRVMVNGEAVCLYQLEDSIHATQDRCSHGNASLAEGYIEDGKIECPLHQGCFDIRTGAAVSAPCKDAIRVYPVKISESTIYVAGDAA